MPKSLRGSRRTLTKRVTSINFYVDQATQIQAIMEATGTTKEAPLVRQLVDEALAARRRKLVPVEAPEQSAPVQDMNDNLQAIQMLLLKLIGQGQTAFRIGSVSLEILQETLTEARAARMGLWESLEVPGLREKGKSAQEIANLFEAKTGEAQDFADGVAQEVKNQLLAEETKSATATIDDDDRQGRVLYDNTDSSDDRGPLAA